MMDEALKGREILIAPNEPSAGVRVAFILDDGAPVELLQFSTAKAVRSKTRHAAEQRAAPDDGAQCVVAGERARYAAPRWACLKRQSRGDVGDLRAS
jgi:hypothetical protein